MNSVAFLMRLRLRYSAIALLALSWAPGPAADAAASAADSVAAAAHASAIGQNTSSVASAATAPDDLGPTSAVPWNPPRAVPRRAAWEVALDLPLRIATFPVSVLGMLTREELLRAEGASVVPRATHILSRTTALGLEARPASLGDRTGFGAEVGVAPPLLRRLVRVEYSGSTLRYNRTTVTLTRGPASLLYQNDWRPEERFYGIGLQSSRHDESDYAVQGELVRLALAWPPSDTARTARLQPRVRAWFGPRDLVLRGGRAADRDVAPMEARFPELATGVLDRRIEHLVYGARLGWDTRDGAPHWSRGAALAVQAERFDAPIRSLAIHDVIHGVSFTRLTLDAETGVSFMRDPRTLRLAGRVVRNEVDGGGRTLDGFIPADLARLGGNEGLWGFPAGRFHDLDMMVARVSYVFPLLWRAEMDAHVEWGGVYHDVTRDPRLDTLKRSYGVHLRPRNRKMPIGFVGVDWSSESVRIRYQLGGVR